MDIVLVVKVKTLERCQDAGGGASSPGPTLVPTRVFVVVATAVVQKERESGHEAASSRVTRLRLCCIGKMPGSGLWARAH